MIVVCWSLTVHGCVNIHIVVKCGSRRQLTCTKLPKLYTWQADRPGAPHVQQQRNVAIPLHRHTRAPVSTRPFNLRAVQTSWQAGRRAQQRASSFVTHKLADGFGGIDVGTKLTSHIQARGAGAAGSDMWPVPAAPIAAPTRRGRRGKAGGSKHLQTTRRGASRRRKACLKLPLFCQH